MNLIIYEHKAQYYETDQMGIIHHSNYIRWFEEARIHLMDSLGFRYDVTEEKGILIPVIGVNCDFKSMTHFNDTVEIITKITQYNGVKLTFSYTVQDKETKEVRCTGSSEHCFISKENKVLSPKRAFVELHEMIINYKNICENVNS